MRKILLTLALSSVLLAAGVFSASAQNTIELQTPLPGTETTTLQLCEGEGENLTCSGILTYVLPAYQWLLVASAILGVVSFMWAGLLWQSSRGDKKQIQNARGIISNTLVGMGLLMSSYLILYIVNPDLVTLNPLNLGSVGKLKKIELNIPIQSDDPSEPNLAADTGPGACGTPSIDRVPLFKQGGYGDARLAQSGCGITSFAMIASYYGKNVTPPAALGAAGTTAASYPGLAARYGLKATEIPGGRNPDIEKVKNLVASQTPVMWYTTNRKFTSYKHWVVITGYDSSRNIFRINDPATGCIKEANEADLRTYDNRGEGWSYPFFYAISR